jgi:hypothetical protein
MPVLRKQQQAVDAEL